MRDLELKNECLADKLTLSDGMNVLLSGSFQSRSKIIYSLVSNGSQQSHERVRALTSELEQAQMQVLKEHKKKCENSVRGKLLEVPPAEVRSAAHESGEGGRHSAP